MDEVLNRLESAIITPETSENRNGAHQACYKNWGRLGNQEERRREILEMQKENRNNKIDTFRGIMGLVQEVEEKNIFKPYNRVHYRPNIYVSGFHKAPATYSNILMLSEWMIERPADFDENWFVAPCPKGARVLVVAHGGTTKAFTKYGHFKQEFRSALPGGNPCEPVKNRCCVLDCFYCDQTKVMYILDLLAWNNQPMTDGEMDFRQYWLKSQLTEMMGLTTINKKNKMVFQLLPMVPCSPESLNKFMMTYPQFEGDVPGLDGLLFYHKRAHYVSGETPLVGWLFPYMVQEVLGSDVTVHEKYSEKPPGYVNQAQFIQAFEAKMAKKRPKNRRRNSAMDTSDSRENATQDSLTDQSTVQEMMEAEEKPVQESVDTAKQMMEAEEKPIQGSVETAKEMMEAEEKPVQESVETAKEMMEAEEKPIQESVETAKEMMEAEEKPVQESVDTVKENEEQLKEQIESMESMETVKEQTDTK